MINAYEPPPEAAREPIDAQEESPLIQAIKDFVLNFRERIFSAGENPDKKEVGSGVESDDQTIKSLMFRYGTKITPHELGEIRQAAEHIGLDGNAGAKKFVESDYNVLSDLSRIHEIAESRMAGLKTETEQKRWKAEVENAIHRTLAAYATRFAIRLGDPDARIEGGVKVYLGDFENVEGTQEQPAIVDKEEAKVIDLSAKRQSIVKPPEQPDDEPEPIEPTTNVA
jgi:hypothetical protein